MTAQFDKWIVIKKYDKVLCRCIEDGKPKKKFVRKEDIGLRKSDYAIPVLFNHREGAVKCYQRLFGENVKTNEEVEKDMKTKGINFVKANINMVW